MTTPAEPQESQTYRPHPVAFLPCLRCGRPPGDHMYPAKDVLTDVDVLTRERDDLRRELSQFDCRRTGGPASDVGGVHCPAGDPCMRCRLESSERERRINRALLDRRENVSAKLEEMTQECHRMRDLACRDSARALEVERQRDTERARADATEARLAKVDAAAAEMVERVKHLVWLASGAPMLGEEPLT